MVSCASVTIIIWGQAWWLTLVIPTLWKAEAVDHLRSGVQDQPGQHGKTPSLPKLAGRGGMHLSSQLLRRLKWENCLSPVSGDCSEPRSHHCTPA